ncbi:MAG: AGE family epimerase/isomerase [Opitutaceae bacterium]|jgi:mannobiose 2-epimerase|nr:AGE family epimerase/isomerase [Opitutaceae bacterium]
MLLRKTSAPCALLACLLILADGIRWSTAAATDAPPPPRHSVDQSWPQRWTEHLDNDVLPFWTAQTTKSASLVSRLRTLHVLAIAISREPDAAIRQRLQEKFEYGLAETISQFHDPHSGDWRSSATVADAPGNPKSTADQAWASLLLADIHLRVRHETSLRLARATLARIDSLAHDGKHGGYFLSYPANECTRNGHESSRKHAPTQLHVLLALANLHLANPQDTLIRARLEELLLHIPRFVSPESGHVRWALARDWTPADFERPINNQTLYGQNAETITYLLAAQAALDRPRGDILPLLEKIARGLIRDGISPEGAVYYLGPMNGPATDQRIWWWPQVETAAALWQLHQITGNNIYRETFDKVSAWTFSHFIPPENPGRWHTLRTAGGQPPPRADAVAASELQTGFHVARCILAIKEKRHPARPGDPGFSERVQTTCH